MRVNLFIGNHAEAARPSLDDHVQWVGLGLEAMGHEVDVSETGVDSNALNLVWEYFTPSMAKAIRESGVRYGIILTEHLKGNTLNGHTDINWRVRFAGFQEAVKGAEFVWTLFPNDVKAASRFAPASHLTLGYVPELELHGDADLDFALFGRRTEDRIKILLDLQDRGFKCAVPGGFLGRRPYQKLLTRAKVHLDVASYNNIPMPSVARVGRAIHAHRSVCMDKTVYTTEPASFFKQKKSGSIVLHAIDRLKTWKEDADRAFDLYQKIPMTQCLEKALDEVRDARRTAA